MMGRFGCELVKKTSKPNGEKYFLGVLATNVFVS
jgi:hypothetical protein